MSASSKEQENGSTSDKLELWMTKYAFQIPKQSYTRSELESRRDEPWADKLLKKLEAQGIEGDGALHFTMDGKIPKNK